MRVWCVRTSEGNELPKMTHTCAQRMFEVNCNPQYRLPYAVTCITIVMMLSNRVIVPEKFWHATCVPGVRH